MSQRAAPGKKRNKREAASSEDEEDALSSEEEHSPRRQSRNKKKARGTKAAAAAKEESYYAEKADRDVQAVLEAAGEHSDDEEPTQSTQNTQREREQRQSARGDITAGAITKIYVENFMCHRKFELRLHKGLNFITGRNGSGKSAIAAAIQLCLGAKARTTGRGSSLSSLVREGSPGPAILRVTIFNEGPEAFKPEVYGDRITVERKIPKSGTASYHLKDVHGKEISSQKAELENMLRVLDVHVDNPCCVLTQEEAKKFIHGKDHEKYEFFLKATGIEKLKEEMMEVSKRLDEIEVDLEAHEKKIEPKRAHVKSLEAQLEQLEELETMELEVKRINVKALWDDHRVAQAVLQTVEGDMASKERELERARNELETETSQSSTSAEDIETLNRELETIQERQNGVEEEITKCARAVQEATRAVDAKKNDVRHLERQKTDYEQRRNVVTAQIRECREKAMQKAQTGERELLAQIEQLESKYEAVRAQDENLHRKRETLRQEEQRLQMDVNRGQSALRQSTQAIANARQDLQRMQNSASQTSTQRRATLLNANFPALLDALQRSRSEFRGPVIGPIGLELQLREGCEQWSAAVERVIGSQLSAFIVTNGEDRMTLDRIMKGTRATVPIVMQAPGPRYQAQRCGGGNAQTVMDTLVFSNDLVFNVLIDQGHIEKVLLVANEDDIVPNFVEKDNNGRDRLRFGASSIVTQNATLVKYSYGNQSSEPNLFGSRNVLSQDMSSILNGIQQNLQRLSQEEQEIRATLQEKERELQQVKLDTRAVEQQIRDNVKTSRDLQRAKERADDELRELQQAQQVQDTTLLEQELAELQDAITTITGQQHSAKEELARLTQEVKVKQNERTAVESRRSAIEKEITDQEKRIDKILRGREQAKQRADRLQRIVNEKQRDLQAAEKEVNQAKEQVAAKLSVAAEATREFDADWDGEPWELNRKETRPTLDKKRKEMEIELREGMKRAGLRGLSVAIVRERCDTATMELEMLEATFNSLKDMEERMKKDQVERKKKWVRRLKKASRDVQNMFNRYVKDKGSTGSVIFDHTEHTLTLQFQVDQLDQNTKANDVRNLSGGERSFVTFSLQLALGHVIESPFRLLDEYDVFLDNVARRLTLDQMQAYARSRDQSFRQFIIITPHTLSDVKTNEYVHIHRMKDPERQTAVGPQQQTL